MINVDLARKVWEELGTMIADVAGGRRKDDVATAESAARSIVVLGEAMGLHVSAGARAPAASGDPYRDQPEGMLAEAVRRSIDAAMLKTQKLTKDARGLALLGNELAMILGVDPDAIYMNLLPSGGLTISALGETVTIN